MTLLRKALLFLLITSSCYLLLFALLANVEFRGARLVYYLDENLAPKGTMHRANMDKVSNGPFDVMVFGSSHAFRGYDPRIFDEKGGVNLFNCGTTAQSMPNTYHYLRHQYEAMPTELVILDVFVDIFTYKEVESSIMIVRNTDLDQLAWDIVKDEKDIRLLNMLTIRYLAMNDTAFYRNPQYVSNGYISKKETMKKPKEKPYVAFEPQERAVERFRQILEYAQEQNINLVLVNQPRPVETNELNNKEFSAFLKKELEGYDFPLFDYALQHDLKTDESYYDLGHMNQHGVDYFNGRLIRDLVAAGHMKGK